MKRIIPYSILFLATITACEDIYNPDVGQVEDALVIDARIEASGFESYVRLTKSLGFNESENGFQPVSGAKVFLISNDNKFYPISETQNGLYPVRFSLNPELQYKIKVEHSGVVYESSFEEVPSTPDLDTVFGIQETKFFLQGGEKDINNAIKKEGVQLYTNILNEKEMPYYRFTARKVLEYTYSVTIGQGPVMQDYTIYGWQSSFPSESFNIAAPPGFSLKTDILKHPLYFIEKRPYLNHSHIWQDVLQRGLTNYIGYILIIYQHGLSISGYDFYKDLNSQLNSEGRMLDPLYVQARNNLKCTSDPQKTVLGNFEISKVKEHRFYVRYASEKIGYYLEPIYNYSPIPLAGESAEVPDFWEPR